MGNVGSISNIIKKVGGSSIVSSDIQTICNAKKLILPGVGSFDNGIRSLKNSGFIEVLIKKVLDDRIPVLGICLGMQMMTKDSEEGSEKGLGWIDASTKRFNFKEINEALRVPHMGWNTVTRYKDHKLVNGIDKANSRFYFVHSYYVSCNNKQDILLTCNYGFDFVAAFQKDNIMGVQFHPEKSHKFGMHMFSNFLSL